MRLFLFDWKMNESNEKAKLLADLVKLLSPEEKSAKDETKEILSGVLARLDEINARFEKIEKDLAAKPNSNPVAIQISPLHPSQERFQIAEANELTLPQTNEKACRFEPDKPCDYCSMCSSRGF